MQGIILVSYIWWDLPLSPSMYSVIWEVPWAAEKNKYSLVNGEMFCQLCPFHLQRYLTLVFLFASCLENLSWQVWVIEISHYQCVCVSICDLSWRIISFMNLIAFLFGELMMFRSTNVTFVKFFFDE